MSQRGNTLIEVVVVAAIVVVIAAAFQSLWQGARAFGTRSASAQVDAALSYARALSATSGNGATLVFDRRRSSDGTVLPGFVLTVYSGRPTGATALQRAMPPVRSSGEVSEAKLGRVPFTIFLNGAGHAGGMTGAVFPGTVVASDPGCPSGETRLVVTFSDSRWSEKRTLACNLAAAGSPVTFAAP